MISLMLVAGILDASHLVLWSSVRAIVLPAELPLFMVLLMRRANMLLFHNCMILSLTRMSVLLLEGISI
jgi:hypothetical protein